MACESASRILRRQPQTGKGQTVGRLGLRHVELAEAKVAECDVAGVIEQNVLGLEVPARARTKS